MGTFVVDNSQDEYVILPVKIQSSSEKKRNIERAIINHSITRRQIINDGTDRVIVPEPSNERNM
jgi:hypothetical protein